MKKLILAASVAFCVIFALSSGYFCAQLAMRHNRTSAAQTKEMNSLRTELDALRESPESFAILREVDGIIGLYDADGKVLLCTIDTPVISLPEHQRGEIMVGLEVKDASHFLRLFENLSQ